MESGGCCRQEQGRGATGWRGDGGTGGGPRAVAAGPWALCSPPCSKHQAKCAEQQLGGCLMVLPWTQRVLWAQLGTQRARPQTAAQTGRVFASDPFCFYPVHKEAGDRPAPGAY